MDKRIKMILLPKFIQDMKESLDLKYKNKEIAITLFLQKFNFILYKNIVSKS